MTGDRKIGAVAATAAKPKRTPPNAGKGRPKGVPNKSTIAVKSALIEAFDKLGGVPALVEWGKATPNEFYKLWARMLPTEVSGPNGGPIQTQPLADELAALSADKRAAIRAAIKHTLEGK